MDILQVVLTYVLELYLLLLIGTLVIMWIRAFARDWQPTGVVLVICESVLSATDPPLKLLRRYIPPLRLGTVALDLSFMVLFAVVLILLEVVVPLL
ncbi:MAG TPA: YggT family protein [Trebonia sp.]|nr:YggT family protein [Trebonia sp.]